MVDAGVFHIMGQSNLTFPVDRQRCARWGVNVADVQDVIATAVGGKAFSQMIEGERSFDIALRWPERLRQRRVGHFEHSGGHQPQRRLVQYRAQHFADAGDRRGRRALRPPAAAVTLPAVTGAGRQCPAERSDAARRAAGWAIW